MTIKFKSGTPQAVYDGTWSALLIIHVLVWGVESFMWPWTYVGWPKFNKIYIMLWTWVG